MNALPPPSPPWTEVLKSWEEALSCHYALQRLGRAACSEDTVPEFTLVTNSKKKARACLFLLPQHPDKNKKCKPKVQKRLRREMRAALSVADVLLAPTTPFPPFASSGAPAAPASLLLNDVLTVPVSLTGVPSISIPVATVPVGAATLMAKTTVRATAATAASSVCDSKGGGGAAVKGRGGARGGADAVVAAGEDEWCRLPLGMQVGYDKCVRWFGGGWIDFCVPDVGGNAQMGMRDRSLCVSTAGNEGRLLCSGAFIQRL